MTQLVTQGSMQVLTAEEMLEAKCLFALLYSSARSSSVFEQQAGVSFAAWIDFLIRNPPAADYIRESQVASPPLQYRR